VKKLFVLLFSFVSVACFAQLKYIGLTGGATFANQKWDFKPLDIKQRMNYKIGGNGSLYTEWGDHEAFTWIVEGQYNQKGARGTDLISGNSFTSKTDYISLNVLLKLRADFYTGAPYFVAGPRVEYLFSQGGAPVGFSPINISASFGAGYDFYLSNFIVPFIEGIYNPSFTKMINNENYAVKGKAWEIKAGIKFRRGAGKRGPRNRHNDCPPVYL
jgi:hypothetical protein